MKLRIVSEDGNPFNTKITNAETGKDIDNIFSIHLRCSANEPWMAQCEMTPGAIDIRADSNCAITADELTAYQNEARLSMLSGIERLEQATIGKWLSAAMSDQGVCQEMRDAITAWWDGLRKLKEINNG